MVLLLANYGLAIGSHVGCGIHRSWRSSGSCIQRWCDVLFHSEVRFVLDDLGWW